MGQTSCSYFSDPTTVLEGDASKDAQADLATQEGPLQSATLKSPPRPGHAKTAFRPPSEMLKELKAQEGKKAAQERWAKTKADWEANVKAELEERERQRQVASSPSTDGPGTEPDRYGSDERLRALQAIKEEEEAKETSEQVALPTASEERCPESVKDAPEAQAETGEEANSTPADVEAEENQKADIEGLPEVKAKPEITAQANAAFMVVGAGLQQFNGEYLPDGCEGSAPRYRKRGGQETMTCGAKGDLWHLCVDHFGDWYNASCSGEFPPSEGWKVGFSGTAPAPSVTCEAAERKALVDAFLTKNGFDGVGSARRRSFRASIYAIHLAAEKGDAKMIELLIEAGADRLQKDSQGRTAEDVARKKNRKGSHDEVLAAIAAIGGC